jgi:hypothetical protein
MFSLYLINFFKPNRQAASLAPGLALRHHSDESRADPGAIGAEFQVGAEFEQEFNSPAEAVTTKARPPPATGESSIGTGGGGGGVTGEANPSSAAPEDPEDAAEAASYDLPPEFRVKGS